MPCPSCATTEQLGTHLDLTVGQPLVVKFEFIPAPCLATTRPAYGEIITPGAGRYKLSVEPYQPHRRPSSSRCGSCTIQMHEGSAAGASPPDTIAREPRSISSSSVPDSPTRRLESTSSAHAPSPQQSPPPAVVARSGSPAPSTFADFVRNCSSPEGTVADYDSSSPGCKRENRQVQGESNKNKLEHPRKRKRDDGD